MSCRSSSLVAAILLVLVAEPAYADPAATATAHALDELANCRAQHRPECPTDVPTATPLPTATRTPLPSATPQATDAPTALPAPTATPGPPCWTDDNGDKWLIVDGGLYFDDTGAPVACPQPVDPNATPESTETPAPFVEPTIFVPPEPPTPIVQVVTQIVHEIQVIHDAPQQAFEPLPTDTPTGVPTATPSLTATPSPPPTPTTTLPWTDTPTLTPTPTATDIPPAPRRTPTPEPPTPPQVARETSSVPGPPTPPWFFAAAGALPGDRHLWPVAVLPLDWPSHAIPPRQREPLPDDTGWITDEESVWPFAGAKGFTRFEKPRLLYIEGSYSA